MTKALLVIDIQNDFCPGGALAVAQGDQIITRVNALMGQFDVVVATQDWHPANHKSFASQHAYADPFSMMEMPYGPQVLWPDHCIQGSEGAAFHKDLTLDKSDLIIRKGFRADIDSYSAFYENDKATPTGLAGYLNERGVTDVLLAGLATDFCVYYSAIDAIKQGFSATLLMDCCRAIDLEGSLNAAMEDMGNKGVAMMDSADLPARSSV
ncbi:MAG: bifunctional nicotinamidase/pyrazinamidase [Pseudomonadota bacterium]